ncbi:RNA polymerase sigma factor [Alkalihalophilus marmarensis]|uniref:RNA polymerase sigma factor n=1 Tax=Alkalihalophilus marmarensis TaxID=521377 RepID=UPI002DBC6AD0|nr:sigma-70 family RNA polymerase sigma factor [Alkalihalophilus marmarensis]MEC2073371.1 sigma-70 family RNA polymerase sigma factor [Alkalihalophilus marmarensis]
MNDAQVGELLQEPLNMIRSYLLKMGAVKEDAEDIIQETAYQFLLYMDSVTIENVEGWLFRVAVNRYYDLSRKQTRRRTILLTFNVEKLIEEATPESTFLRLEEGTVVRAVLAKLKEKYSELLLLKYSTGLSIQEIAEVVGMKEGTVKTNLYRARQQFIKEYRRLEDDR